MLRLLAVSIFYMTVDAKNHSEVKHLRVGGGEDVEDGEYPFVVVVAYIKDLDHKWCSAAMLSPDWAVTAAYPFYDDEHVMGEDFFDNLAVWYGNFTASPVKTKLYSRVRKIIIHPDFYSDPFHRPSSDHNIALLHVKDKIDLITYGMIATKQDLIGKSVTFVGGGPTRPDRMYDLTAAMYEPLQAAKAVIQKCYENLLFTKIPKLCVDNHAGGTTTYQWDVGCPLLLDDHTILGVLTDYSEDITVFLPLHVYSSWIEETMRMTAVADKVIPLVPDYT
ncbi:hypothetical protein B5X24_HaOG211499 [Helicoverpa armigera]|nr:hypothetical protein B5X24_HaOG211499 [Helicoverpa armigera]